MVVNDKNQYEEKHRMCSKSDTPKNCHHYFVNSFKCFMFSYVLVKFIKGVYYIYKYLFNTAKCFFWKEILINSTNCFGKKKNKAICLETVCVSFKM